MLSPSPPQRRGLFQQFKQLFPRLSEEPAGTAGWRGPSPRPVSCAETGQRSGQGSTPRRGWRSPRGGPPIPRREQPIPQHVFRDLFDVATRPRPPPLTVKGRAGSGVASAGLRRRRGGGGKRCRCHRDPAAGARLQQWQEAPPHFRGRRRRSPIGRFKRSSSPGRRARHKALPRNGPRRHSDAKRP